MKQRKKLVIKQEPSKFTLENMKATVRDLQSGKLKMPRDRVTFADDMVIGLRAVMYISGQISAHVQYDVAGIEGRPSVKIGDLNEDSEEYISLEGARELAKTIKAIGEEGIDVQHGLHRRLWEELRRDGVKWRPRLSSPAR